MHTYQNTDAAFVNRLYSTFGALLALATGLLLALATSAPAGAQQRTYDSSAHTEKAQHHHGKLQANGRFESDHDQWPPQPRGIEAVAFQESATSLDEALANTAAQEAVRILAESTPIAPLLGERYSFLGRVSLASKENQHDTREVLTFFSQSANRTVEVTVDDGEIHAVEQITPEVYQPPLATDEVQAAVALARNHWLAADGGRVASFKGFGILAFRDEGDSGFYDSRVVYVTFHEHIDGRPEYIAYVDLSSKTILESWEE